MSKLTLDAPSVEKLRSVTETVEVCDEAGNALGSFVPLVEREKRALAALRRRFSPEDLRKMAAEAKPGKTLEQIKKELGVP